MDLIFLSGISFCKQFHLNLVSSEESGLAVGGFVVTGQKKEQSSDSKSVVELTNGSLEDGKETSNTETPKNNPQYPQFKISLIFERSVKRVGKVFDRIPK
ncbi:hypothetical protein DITRI_Ditri15bG0073900 [Diplodiscus trichospermus]